MVNFVDYSSTQNVLKNFTFRLRYPAKVLDSSQGNHISVRERKYEAYHFDKEAALKALCLISPHFAEAVATYPERLKCEIGELTQDERCGTANGSSRRPPVMAGATLSLPRREIGSWPDDEQGVMQVEAQLAFLSEK